MSSTFWGKTTFCVIAGASKGIGQAIASVFSTKLGPGSVLLLLSRSAGALENTKANLLSNPENKCASIQIYPVDLSSPDSNKFTECIRTGFTASSTDPSQFSHFILVQVAASLGLDLGLPLLKMQDVSYLRSYYDFNLLSFILLNSVFIQETVHDSLTKNATIIHISSHGAVHPYKTWGLYCAARAAKDMLLRSIALESPNVQTLNYAPGVVDTDNYAEALALTPDPEMVKLFEKEKEMGKLLTPMQTATKLADILAQQKFVKGEHISYSDH